MPPPDEYCPDSTEGTTRIDDLPKIKIAYQSRNYRRRPCPHCAPSSYRDRDRVARRDLLPPDWSIWYESHSRPSGQEDFR